MCGNFGIIGNSYLTIREIELFRTLGVINHLRGTDGTGIIKIDKKGDMTSIKRTWPSPFFLYSRDFQDFVHWPVTKTRKNGNAVSFVTSYEDECPKILIGHARAATLGEINEDNCHPFETDNLIGMHNGTIQRRFEGAEDFDTDSEALYNLISDKGLKKGLQEVYNKTHEPAFALQFYDKTTKEVKFIRNHERSLWFAPIAGGTSLAWSSDLTHLHFALQQMKMKPHVFSFLKDLDKKNLCHLTDSGFFQPTLHTLMNYEVGKPLAASLNFEALKVYSFDDSFQGFCTDVSTKVTSNINKSKNQNTALTVTHPSPKREDENKVLSFPPNSKGKHTRIPDKHQINTSRIYVNYKGYEGFTLGKKQLTKLLDKGCTLCHQSIDHKDYDAIASLKWHAHDEYICGDCQTQWTPQQIEFYLHG